MTDAERSGADHIVLPRRSAGLASARALSAATGGQRPRRRAGCLRRSRRHRPRSLGRHRLDRATRDRLRDALRGGRRQPVRAARRDRVPHVPRARGPRCGIRAARRLTPRRRPAAAAPRRALRVALRGVPAAGRGRPVHLAARRRRSRPQGVPLCRLRRLAGWAGGAGGAGRRDRSRQARPGSTLRHRCTAHRRRGDGRRASARAGRADQSGPAAAGG